MEGVIGVGIYCNSGRRFSQKRKKKRNGSAEEKGETLKTFTEGLKKKKKAKIDPGNTRNRSQLIIQLLLWVVIQLEILTASGKLQE